MFVGGGELCYGPYGTTGKALSADGPSLDCLDVEPVQTALETLIGDARRSGVDTPRSTETVVELLNYRL
jgi:hypothetical protein